MKKFRYDVPRCVRPTAPIARNDDWRTDALARLDRVRATVASVDRWLADLRERAVKQAADSAQKKGIPPPSDSGVELDRELAEIERCRVERWRADAAPGPKRGIREDHDARAVRERDEAVLRAIKRAPRRS